MEELRKRLEEIAELITQKEDEISLLKQDLDAIRVALEVAADTQEEQAVEPEEAEQVPDLQQSEQPIVEEKEVPFSAPISDESPEEPKEEQSEIENEGILRAIDTMSQEMGAPSTSENEQYEEGATVGDKANFQRLSDLKKAIGLNERFLFANELFNGDVEALGRAIEELNHVERADAERLINEEFATRYSWDEENTTVITFKSLVARRFI